MSPLAARPEDAAAIAALEDAFPTGRWSEHAWSEEIGSPRACVLIEPGATGPAGVIAFSVAGDTADLNRVIVAPDARRAGVARRLVLAGLTWAAEAGASQVMLEVEADNAAARALYDHVGFVALATRANYYGPGRDALVMALPLGGAA
ncbi:GNAT family N-acetyltransferase [Propioniciclava coleopterorum]|uniref:GNAT family N-acetyltransferase n=1 Tax=Propioniciclava coleopterorum TaxID=2714937 RepID=A0A6G7Y433_9ACTN|nr:GNAT family N-acetyltransferase [Propioniciclava coleopterorum]QIK71391.1 GNAT family N-acetyltransferase [Propioniciclava coleopterorum]